MPYYTGLIEVDVSEHEDDIAIEFESVDDVIDSALQSGFTLEQIAEGLTSYTDFSIGDFIIECGISYEIISDIYHRTVLNHIHKLDETNKVLKDRIQTLEKKEDVMTASDIQEKLVEDEEVKISDVAY
tara:strand:- start:503 stop:886 length:384 start_codon:yes stop_codon:yes gene_type:complete